MYRYVIALTVACLLIACQLAVISFRTIPGLYSGVDNVASSFVYGIKSALRMRT
jgi:hypothetical protein